MHPTNKSNRCLLSNTGTFEPVQHGKEMQVYNLCYMLKFRSVCL